jgi:hypothetical protein
MGQGTVVLFVSLSARRIAVDGNTRRLFFKIIILYYAPALAQLDARYALGALCVVCDER